MRVAFYGRSVPLALLLRARTSTYPLKGFLFPVASCGTLRSELSCQTQRPFPMQMHKGPLPGDPGLERVFAFSDDLVQFPFYLRYILAVIHDRQMCHP